MKKITYACIFIMINITILFNEAWFDVIPDFIGYIMLMAGLVEVSEKSENFKNLRTPSLMMIFISGFIFMNTAASNVFPMFISSIFMTALIIANLYILEKLILGFKDIEENENIDFRYNSLSRIFKTYKRLNIVLIIAVFIQVVVLTILPIESNLNILNLSLSLRMGIEIIITTVSITYIYILVKASKDYNKIKSQEKTL